MKVIKKRLETVDEEILWAIVSYLWIEVVYEVKNILCTSLEFASFIWIKQKCFFDGEGTGV